MNVANLIHERVRGSWRTLGVSAIKIIARTIAAIAVALIGLVGLLLTMATQPYWPAVIGLAVVVAGAGLAWLLSHRYAAVYGAAVTLVAAIVGWSQLTASTPAIRDAAGTVVPGSVASIERVTLGGIDQTVIIRGRSVDNPVLLYLAGGPGGTQVAWNRQFNSALEDAFVVAQWEQRGAGKSAGALFADWGGATPEQYVADGLELTAYLRDRFHEDKIYLVAQSWGTMPAVWMVEERPEWYAAYVGIGQMVSPVDTDTLGYNYVLNRARTEGRSELVNALEASGPPPYHGLLNMPQYQRLIGAMNDYQAASLAADPLAARISYAGMTESPEYGLADTVAAFLGGGLTFARVYDQLDDVDLDAQAAVLDVPVWFVEGRHDLNSFPELARRYFEVLQAPEKHLVWFDHAGHNPMHEAADEFNALLVDDVLGSRS